MVKVRGMEPPLADLRAFLRLYAAGEFWESHEILEGPWRRSRDSFTQALILYASAWVHWQRGNAHGVQAQLAKALDRLDGLPSARCGVDIDALRRHARACRTRVLSGDEGWSRDISPLPLEPPLAPAHHRVVVEGCATSTEEARACVAAGAHRVELCRALEVGGLTPQTDLVRRTVQAVAVPVHVLLRHRSGPASLSSRELEDHVRTAERMIRAGAAGIVTGALDAGGKVDRDALKAVRRVVPAACQLTFHRAFDRVRDPAEGLEDLVRLGVDAVLTSGRAAKAREGVELLATLHRQGAGRITVMAGGGVRGDHVVALVDATGVTAVHARAAAIPALTRRLGDAGLLADSQRTS
jgi:copper homeostasis protein